MVPKTDPPDEGHRFDHAAEGEDSRQRRPEADATIRPGLERLDVAAYVCHRGQTVAQSLGAARDEGASGLDKELGQPQSFTGHLVETRASVRLGVRYRRRIRGRRNPRCRPE